VGSGILLHVVPLQESLLRRLSGALTMLALSVLSNVHLAAGQEGARTDQVRKELDGWYSGLAADGEPGFAVLVKQNGKMLFAKSYGLRDLRNKQAIDSTTNFRLASCTKQFTAMAIMLLVHDGKLRYDEALTEIFPEFPAYGKAITVRNLLNHTSGLPDYENLMDVAEKQNRPTWTPEKQIRDGEVLQLLEKEQHGKFAPSTKWEYSNSGYVVLGLIVASRSGKSFGAFLQERIFSPLRMNGTLVFEKGKNKVANRAYGHFKRDGRFIETDQSSTSATQGDGGVYSNLEDLSKWDDALRIHALLSDKEFVAATTPANLPAGAEQKLAEDAPDSLRGKALAYGFGWFLDLQNPHPLMWHYGDTVGFKTAVLRYLDCDLAVIVLCNRTDLDAGALALKAASVASNSH
jgi:CubicO group peptidase (beta-lactamase class C family)